MDAGADAKLIHGKASMAKLFMSEAACRCADRVQQVFGGRGYIRTTTAERFWRELRVDRIEQRILPADAVHHPDNQVVVVPLVGLPSNPAKGQ